MAGFERTIKHFYLNCVVGLIKADGIWNEAKSFRMERQVQEIRVASALFENKMGRLPGAPIATPGIIDNSVDDWNDELAAENLVVSAAKALIHPFGGAIWLQQRLLATTPFSADLNIITLNAVPWAFARALDEKLDDGDGTTGNIMATTGLGSPAAVAYAVANPVVTLWIRLQ